MAYAGAPANFDATAYDYHPDYSSPAINVGDNSHVLPPYDMDLDGLQRIQGGVVDLGCYESDLNVSVQRVTEQPGALYFDMDRGELCITDQSLITGPIAIHDLSGKLQARLTLRQARTRLDLPTGVYVASGAGAMRLKFAVR
ncbi:MAG: choice-of-anchor Q domain-containing protein [Flavobacteriales bacterium]